MRSLFQTVCYGVRLWYPSTGYACMMSNRNAWTGAGSQPLQSPMEGAGQDLTGEHSSPSRSKYGPRGVRKRHRKTSQSVDSENKRSMSDQEANPITVHISRTSIRPGDLQRVLAECDKRPSSGETAPGTGELPVDLTVDDPAIVVVGSVMRPPPPQQQQQQQPVLVDLTRPDEQSEAEEAEAAEQARRELERERAMYEKKVAALVQRPWDCSGIDPYRWDTRMESYLPFTIISYNLLSQDLLENNMFLYGASEENHLAWSYRSNNLLKELRSANADILCLQEVNGEHYNEFYKPELTKLGYSGAFKQRTGDKHDGCATFFKTAMFELEESVPVEYFKPRVPVLDRDNVGLLVLLRPRHNRSNRKLCVANTHLLFNPKRGDIKLAQLMVLFSEIDKLSFKDSRHHRHGKYHPVIVCGDLNAEPHCDLYKLIVGGYLNYEGLATKVLAGQVQPGGYSNYLGKVIVPPGLGITDQCQHLGVLESRNQIGEQQQSPEVSTAAVQVTASGAKISAFAQYNRQSAASSTSIAVDSPWQHNQLPRQQAPAGNQPCVPEGQKPDQHVNCTTTPQEPLWLPVGLQTQQNPGVVPGQQGQVTQNLAQQGTSSGPRAQLAHSTQPAWTQCSGTVSHKLKLTSVYHHEVRAHHRDRRHRDRGHRRDHGQQGDREVTTFHGRASCTVDYIFYSVDRKKTCMKGRRVQTSHLSEGRLKLVGRLRLPTETDMNEIGDLPNDLVSSDHVKLMAKFLLKLK